MSNFMDTKQVQSHKTSHLQNKMHIAFWNGVQKVITAFVASADSATAALGTKLAEQWGLLTAAIQQEDEYYLLSSASEYTAQLLAKDERRDVLTRTVRRIVEAYAYVEIDAEKHEAALKMQPVLEKYAIDVSLPYEQQTVDTQQWLQEQTGSAKLTKAAQTLGLKATIEELSAVNDEIMNMLRLRKQEQGQTPEEALKKSRAVSDTEYKYFVIGLNATILADPDEAKWEPLVEALNNEIDISKKESATLARENAALQAERAAAKKLRDDIAKAQKQAKKAVKDGTWVDPDEEKKEEEDPEE